MQDTPQNPESVLSAVFGYREFRPGQREIIDAIQGLRDVLAIMPTGGGKSICYQVPAIALPGCAIVISPLISLMKDQVDTLCQMGVSAAYINSALDGAEVVRRMNAARAGKYKLLYIAPERLVSDSFADLLLNIPLSFVAIDEAHCVSQWGHDFRPSYVRIAQVLDRAAALTGKRIPRVALTATATPEVKTDIVTQLDLMEPAEFLRGFDRKNLTYHVRSSTDKVADLGREIDLRRGQSIVVYCATRRNVERLARTLAALGHTVGAYHGGLSNEVRSRIQEDFVADRIRVIVATNAFGMGIDKPDVRAVFHHDMPGSLEAYYQEAGRAGRDGEPAECILLFDPRSDRRLQEFIIDASYPTREAIRALHGLMVAWPDTVFDMTPDEICATLPVVKKQMVESIFTLLEAQEIIKPVYHELADGNLERRWAVHDAGKEPDTERLYARRQVAINNLAAMDRFCRTLRCRRRHILRYFGDKSAPDFCGACDICLSKSQTATEAVMANARYGGDLHDAARVVFRAIRQTRETYGQPVITKMLLGVADSHVMHLGKGVTAYGALKQWSRQQVDNLLADLMEGGYLVQGGGKWAHLSLTKKAYQAVKDKQPINLTGSEEAAAPVSRPAVNGKPIARPAAPGKRASLVERVRSLRETLSREENVPPFMIFGERTMRELVEKAPQTVQDLEGVFGLGAEKIRRFGDKILNVTLQA